MHRFTSLYLALSTFMIVPAALTAQDTLRVNDPRVDGSFIQDFSVEWLATRTYPDGHVATFTVGETFDVLGDDGDALLKMTQTWNDTLGQTLFVTVRVAHHASMEVAAFHSGAPPGGFGHLDFHEGFVTGVYVPAAEERLLNFSLLLDERPFASMAGVLMASFPLASGARFAYAGMGWGGTTNPNVTWRELEVMGRERIDVPGVGEMESWKVRSGNATYWISRSAPYFLRADAVNSAGQRTVFTIADWKPGT